MLTAFAEKAYIRARAHGSVAKIAYVDVDLNKENIDLPQLSIADYVRDN